MEGTRAATPVSTHLVWSIITTLCCCLPIGIAAIVYSSKASGANSAGDVARAQEASRTAKILNIVGLVLGIIIIIIVIVLQVVGGRH
ncbi:hypothetical protein GJAV_G00057000 [Gymnothorax javanicus]|nr:hypothetical protein GJAV_G00057000 [Gymnothorax javanicus]